MAETASYMYQSLIIRDDVPDGGIVIGNFMETMARLHSGQIAVRAECSFLRNKPDKRYGGHVFLPEGVPKVSGRGGINVIHNLLRTAIEKIEIHISPLVILGCC